MSARAERLRQMDPIRNALTVDVEDYFHVSAFASCLDRSDWESLESRVERNTSRLLKLFDDAGVSATFFMLGWVAERFPNLVREICAAKHELACHGYSHQLIYKQSQDVFRQETVRAKRLLEDISGREVAGYRAASYSITKNSQWALDILVEAGFAYDSSIVPVAHDIYGMSGARAYPYRIEMPDRRSITEFPPSTISLLGYRLPIGGGGYFRLFPFWFSNWGLRRINERDEMPFSFYLHPWEIDPDQPRISAGWKSSFRHYNNLEKCERRLQRLLTNFRFDTMSAVLAASPVESVDLRDLETGSTANLSRAEN